MEIKAEYIQYMSAYKEQTIAYIEDLEEAEKLAIENGYDCLILEDN